MIRSRPAVAPLSAEQVAEFFREGFLVIEEPQIDSSELAWCRGILMRLIDSGTGSREGRRFDLAGRDQVVDEPSPQLLSPAMYAPELRDFSLRATTLAMARQLLGPEASFAGDHTILKPRRIGGSTPWHQDEAFRDPAFDHKEISFWIAMDDSTVDNGAMAYVPRSHLNGVLPHRLNGGSRDANSIECHAGFDPGAARVQPIPAGAMIIHHWHCVHGASRNHSDSDRLAYILSYTTPPTPRSEPRSFPWLRDLRKSVRTERARYLLRGGALRELWRILRSDRYADRHFLSGFARRRIAGLRRLFSR